MADRHAIAQHSGNKLCVVPVLRVEFLVQALDGCLVSALVLKLEIIAVSAVFVGLLDDFSLCNALRKQDSLIVILQACEYLVWITIEQSDESHPLVTVVLETDNVALKLFRTVFDNLQTIVCRESHVLKHCEYLIRSQRSAFLLAMLGKRIGNQPPYIDRGSSFESVAVIFLHLNVLIDVLINSDK